MQENEDKFDTTAEKTPIKKQNSKHEAIESEEVQLLSPMVFAQPVNGHPSSSMNNDPSIIGTNFGDVTPLTKNQLSQVIYLFCILRQVRSFEKDKNTTITFYF